MECFYGIKMAVGMFLEYEAVVGVFYMAMGSYRLIVLDRIVAIAAIYSTKQLESTSVIPQFHFLIHTCTRTVHALV